MQLFSFDLHPLPSLVRRGPGVAACLASWLVLGGCAPESDAFGEPVGLREATLELAASSLTAVSLGESATCVTTVGGHAKCWGRSDDGRLGQGRTFATSQAEPSTLDPIALGAAATSVVTNGPQSFALLADGTVRAFGVNASRELGLLHVQTIGDDETPAAATVATLVPLHGTALQLAVGEGFACARLDDGRVQCWGRGDEGQLGRGAEPGSHAPRDVLLGGAAVEITAGAAHACARLPQGNVRCWGLGDAGQLGYGQPLGDVPPYTAGHVPLGGVATQVVAGGAHTCARLESGAVRCWGDNTDGQLGYGHTDSIGDDETPADVGDVELGGAAVQLVAGLRHTCAVLTSITTSTSGADDGVLRCWGDNTSAQLGLPSVEAVGDDEHPAEVEVVDMGGLAVASVFAGALAEHTCALRGDGQLRCWGLDDHGQVGLGFVSPQDPVEGPPGDLPDVIIVEDPD